MDYDFQTASLAYVLLFGCVDKSNYYFFEDQDDDRYLLKDPSRMHSWQSGRVIFEGYNAHNVNRTLEFLDRLKTGDLVPDLSTLESSVNEERYSTDTFDEGLSGEETVLIVRFMEGNTIWPLSTVVETRGVLLRQLSFMPTDPRVLPIIAEDMLDLRSDFDYTDPKHPDYLVPGTDNLEVQVGYFGHANYDRHNRFPKDLPDQSFAGQLG